GQRGGLPRRGRVGGGSPAERPDGEGWEERLRSTRHVAPLVRDYRRCGPLVVRPAESSMLERSTGSGWIAIGAAAASYDPIASRWLVAALASGRAAASLVAAAFERLGAYHA